MWKKNEQESFNGRTCWDIYCMNCNSYLGSTSSGESHCYERGGICSYYGKDIDKKKSDGFKS